MLILQLRGFGVEVIRREGRWFVRYDSGEIVVSVQEYEIAHEQAIKVQRSEKQAYEVLLECELRSEEL